MAIGDVQGQNFRLPQNRYIGQQPGLAPAAAGAPVNIPLPNTQDAYADVQGVNDEFVDTVGQLRSYTQDMSKRYGIDVTQPDYAQPGGGQPYRTFQELAAKATMTANDLKQRMKENAAIQAGQLSGTILPQGDYENADLGTPLSERAVSTTLLPEVQKAAQSLSLTYDTPQGAARATASFKKPLVEKLTALRDSDPQNAAFYQRQIDALPDAIYEPVQFSPSAIAGGSKKNYEAEALKEISNQALGRWSAGQFAEDVDNDGNPILISKAKEGQRYGFDTRESGSGSKKREVQIARVIDHWEKKSNDEVWIHFKPSKDEDGAKFQPAPERVDDQNPGTVVANFFQSNAHLGNYATALGQARDLGWTDASGYVNPETLPTAPPAAGTEELSSKAEKVKAGVATYLKDLRGKVDNFTKGNEKSLSLKIGDKDVVIKKGYFGNYVLENGVELKDGMTNAELVDFMAEEYKKDLSREQLKALPKADTTKVNVGGKKAY